MARDSRTPIGSDTDGGGTGHTGDACAPKDDPERHRDRLGVLLHLSHEIRTPLNSILALSQLLRDGMTGTLNPEQQRYVEVIERNGQNLIRLVNDVLDLSRMESGHIKVEIRSLDLADQLRATAAALAPLAEVKKIKLNVEPLDDLPPVRCDPDRLRQILTNLIGNAIKFTDRGRVVLSAEARADVVAVHVSDTGVGIPEIARFRLFEEFFQVGGADALRKEGAGLGLAIANRLIRLMGGEISVKSAEGIGSRFTFTLPRGESGRPETPHVLGSLGRDRAGDLDRPAQVSEDSESGIRVGHRFRDERHGTNTPGR